MSLHGKKWLGKKNPNGWHCDKILIHLKEFAPSNFWEFHILVGMHTCYVRITTKTCMAS